MAVVHGTEEMRPEQVPLCYSNQAEAPTEAVGVKNPRVVREPDLGKVSPEDGIVAAVLGLCTELAMRMN